MVVIGVAMFLFYPTVLAPSRHSMSVLLLFDRGFVHQRFGGLSRVEWRYICGHFMPNIARLIILEYYCVSLENIRVCDVGTQ